MAVRNQHSRQSTNYIYSKIGNTFIMIEPGNIQSKSICYSVRKNILSGKLVIPQKYFDKGTTILVTCNGKGKFDFDNI